MKKFKVFICVFAFFIFSSSVFAEDKCSDSKVEELKKQVAKVSIVSQYDEEGTKEGVFNRYLVTLYELPKGFFVKNKGQSVLLIPEDAVDGVISEYIYYDTGYLYLYSYDCPSQPLKQFDLKLKRYNIFYGYDECKDIEEGELDVCNKFYDKDITYDQFIKAVEKYKNDNDNDIIKKSGSFIENNIVIIGVVVGILVIVVILLLVRNVKNNRLD